MEKLKLLAYFKEFPWLQTFIGNRTIADFIDIKIQRVDLPLLREFGFARTALLDANGNLLGEVGKIPCTPKPRRWFRRHPLPYIPDYCEMVGEAIERLGVQAGDVHFIVNVTDKDGLVVGVCIYKPPKNWTIREWLEEEAKKCQKEVRAEVDKIDKV